MDVQQVMERLREFWGKQNMTAKALIAGLPLLIVILGIASMTMLSNKPVEMAVLLTDAVPGDARKVVEELEKQGVSVQLRNGGKDIYVPMAQVDRLKLELGGMGLTGSHIGFEIFDKQKWGATQTEIEIDQQRALQGELARIIESNESVKSAMVVLNLAPETSFVDHGEQSSATVSVVLEPDAGLNAGQVKGITHLVSMAVPKLKPENVTVTDQHQNLLSGDGGGGGMGMQANGDQLKYKAQVEQDLKGKILEVLAAYGPGKVRATVTLDMDFSQRKVQSENYTPVIGDSGIERSVYEKREKSSSSGASPGGVPGSTPNTPGYLGIDGEAGGSGSGSSKTETTVQYEINKEVSDATIPPGVIKKRSASVAIDTDNWTPEIEKAVEIQVAAAIGADLSRGDSVIAQGFIFDPAARQTLADAGGSGSAAASAMRGQTVRNIASWGIALLMIGLLAVLLRSLVNQLAPREPLLAGYADMRGGVELDHEMGGADDGFVLKHLDNMSDSQTQKMRSEIERLIDNRPEVVAGLVRNWLLED